MEVSEPRRSFSKGGVKIHDEVVQEQLSQQTDVVRQDELFGKYSLYRNDKEKEGVPDEYGGSEFTVEFSR